MPGAKASALLIFVDVGDQSPGRVELEICNREQNAGRRATNLWKSLSDPLATEL